MAVPRATAAPAPQRDRGSARIRTSLSSIHRHGAHRSRDFRGIPNGLWLNNKSVFDCTGRFVFSFSNVIHYFGRTLMLSYLVSAVCYGTDLNVQSEWWALESGAGRRGRGGPEPGPTGQVVQGIFILLPPAGAARHEPPNAGHRGT